MSRQKFEILKNALEELGWNGEKTALARQQEIYDQKLYFVAFIGQYSAGKSCLINNLLGKNILPVNITETTPLLTYVRYGEREHARLHYLSGAVQILEPDQVAGIAQTNGGKWNLDELDYLEVFVPEPTFQNGMVLLDTPGINTTIQRHEVLLSSSLAIASKIIYVVNGAPSLVDMNQLEMLTSRGFDISFVRTRCDEINSVEQSVENVIRSDLATLARVGISAENCYHVSNLPNAGRFGEIAKIQQMLEQKGAQATRELEQSVNAQQAALAQRCCAALEEKQQLLRAANDKDTAALEKKRQELESQIQNLQSTMAQRRERLEKQVQECQRNIEGEMFKDIENALEQSASEIENSHINNEEQMQDMLRRKANQMARSASQILNEGVNPIVTEINGALDLSELSLEERWLPQAEDYVQVRDVQDGELEQLKVQLQAVKENRDALQEKIDELLANTDPELLCEELKMVEDRLAEVTRQYKELPPYVPKLIEVESDGPRPSEIGRTIGNIADWALLLLPGASIGGAAAKLAGSSKFVGWLAKLLGGTQKVTDILIHGDSIKDILFALKQMSKTYRTARRREQAKELIVNTADTLNTLRDNAPADMLDLLSIGHWTEQIGKQFDKPPKKILDRVHEKEYLDKKKELEQKMLAEQQETFRKKKEKGLFESEKERLEAERQSLIVDEEKLQADLNKRENEIRLAAERKGYAAWRQECAEWYRETLSGQLRMAVRQYAQELPERLGSYQDSRMSAVMAQLEENRAAHDAIVNADPTETAVRLQTVTTLLEQVRTCL